MWFCDRTKFCYNGRETTCAKIKEAQAIALISFILNFIPSAQTIKGALVGVKAAKALGKKALKAAIKKAVQDCARDVAETLATSALRKASLYFLVNGKAIKEKYLDAFLDSDDDEGNLVSEVVFESWAMRDEIKSDIVDYMASIDPTGLADVIAAFSAESCATAELETKAAAANSAFDLLPLCLFEGNNLGDCTHSNYHQTVR